MTIRSYFVSVFASCALLSACAAAERVKCSAPQSAQDIKKAEVLVRTEMQRTFGPKFLPAIDKSYDLVRAEQCGDRVWFEYHPKQVTAEGLAVVGAELLYAVTLSSGAVVNLTMGD